MEVSAPPVAAVSRHLLLEDRSGYASVVGAMVDAARDHVNASFFLEQ